MTSTTIPTCGLPPKRSLFTYSGNSHEGIVVEYPSGNKTIPREIIDILFDKHEGPVMLGASMTSPTEGGLGEFISLQQQIDLTPRNLSHLIGVLFHENRVEINHRGYAVVVIFPIH